MSRWSVYMLRCGDGSLYTGIATDVSRRVTEHEIGTKGSRYLRGRGPFKVVLQAEVGDRGLATRLEMKIKRLRKHEKERFILTPCRIDELVAASDGGAGPEVRTPGTVTRDRVRQAGPAGAGEC